MAEQVFPYCIDVNFAALAEPWMSPVLEEAMDLAQGNLRGAGIELKPSAMRAPLFGSVAEILVDQDDTVADGQTVVIVSPSDRYVFEFRISEDDADLISEGQRIEVELEVRVEQLY